MDVAGAQNVRFLSHINQSDAAASKPHGRKHGAQGSAPPQPLCRPHNTQPRLLEERERRGWRHVSASTHQVAPPSKEQWMRAPGDAPSSDSPTAQHACGLDGWQSMALK